MKRIHPTPHLLLILLFLGWARILPAADVAPTVTIVSPQDGTATQANTIEVTVTFEAGANPNAKDKTTGNVQDVDLLVDGQVVQTFSNSPDIKQGTHTFTVDVTGGVERVLTFQACAYQGNRQAGLKGCSQIVRIGVDRGKPPVIAIAVPAEGAVFRASPITVTGAVFDASPLTTLTVAGSPVTLGPEGQFTAQVTLREGKTTIIVDAKDQFGVVGTASVSVFLDTTAPTVVFHFPTNGMTLAESPVAVAGFVNDIVDGTVNEGDVTVTVNGTAAKVSNRNFAIESFSLQEGANTLTAVATDRAGNTGSSSISVILDTSPKARIEVVSGNNQTGPINAELPTALVVSLTDAAGQPVAGASVVFRVAENDGTIRSPAASGQVPSGRAVVAPTDANGQAQAFWKLGSRSGAGVNRVEATAAGFLGVAGFCASGLPAQPVKLNVHAGERQRGLVFQALPLPLVAIVTDDGHNACQGCPVTFTVQKGGGTFNGQTSITVNSDANGHAAAIWTLGGDLGPDGQKVVASIPGQSDPIENTKGIPPTGLASIPVDFVATALQGGPVEQTRVSGVVHDNQNEPVPGATMKIHGTSLQTATDAQGQFTITGAPVGNVRLLLDASTIVRPGKWSDMEYDLVTFAGADNNIGMPIIILPLNEGKESSGVEDVSITLPEVPGFELKIPAGTKLTFPDGSTSGKVSVTQVHSDKVPMVPEDGMQPRLFVTIQPAGVHFDPPAPVSYPNVENLKPGQIVELFSFDHDVGRFVMIGTGSVSEDGTQLRSNPGVGVIKGGWHCGAPPGSLAGVLSASFAFLNPPSIVCKDAPTKITINGTPAGGSFDPIWVQTPDPTMPGAVICSIVPGTEKDEGAVHTAQLEVNGATPGKLKLKGTYICPATNQRISGDIRLSVAKIELRQANHPDVADTEIEANDIAWIIANPSMPALSARVVPDLQPAVDVLWSLATTYPRRGILDDRNFPASGRKTLPSNQIWDINSEFAGQFLGGDATLKYKIDDCAEQTLVFKIHGRNPLDATAKAYIISAQGAVRYAWAIAQEESRQGNRVFNQFNSGVTLGGEPNFGGPDGWGIFQVDSRRGSAITTGEVWNWQTNVAGGIAELQRIRQEVPEYFNAIQRTFPTQWEPPPATYTPPRTTTTLTYLEAAEITLYNGASVVRALNDPFGETSKYRSCWRFLENNPSGQRWEFVPNENDYVFRVIYNEFEGHLPITE